MTERAARRDVMRQAKIPTSQQPLAQSYHKTWNKDAEGYTSSRQQVYEVPKEGGGKKRLVVQRCPKDLRTDHADQLHYEAGEVKPGGQRDSTGRLRQNGNKFKCDVKPKEQQKGFVASSKNTAPKKRKNSSVLYLTS